MDCRIFSSVLVIFSVVVVEKSVDERYRVSGLILGGGGVAGDDVDAGGAQGVGSCGSMLGRGSGGATVVKGVD